MSCRAIQRPRVTAIALCRFSRQVANQRTIPCIPAIAETRYLKAFFCRVIRDDA